MPEQLRVMISSTALDLPEHRKEVMDACLRQGMFPTMMEHLPASDAEAISVSLKLVEEANIYVGVFAHRYGYVPKSNNPQEISITEMEYNRAVERTVPRLIFVMDKTHPITIDQVEQGEGATKLNGFIERLQAENIVNFFKSPDDLRAHVINSLSRYLVDTRRQGVGPSTKSAATEGTTKDDQDTGLFDYPAFTDQVTRSSLLTELHRLGNRSPVVCVEGLPGSGKTFLVASYLMPEWSAYGSILWYDTHDKENLTDFLARVETRIRLSSVAIGHKCKELVHRLHEQNALLVIDDFHQVDQPSYSVLIDIASKYGTQARVLLISRTYFDLVRHSPRIGHLEVTGFSSQEMNRFLQSRRLEHLTSATIEDLIRKTDGLPLAASFFSTLVLDFGRHPSDLLAGNMVNTVRFRTWFDEVLSLVGYDEARLLHVMSVCDGPFNLGIVRKLCEHVGIGDPEQAFEVLQRAYLVQKYSSYRWNVHQLIAMFCLSEMKTADRRAINSILARHYLAGFRIARPRILDEEEFFWKMRACRQFQLAGEYTESEKVLHDLSKTVNFRGHYDSFIQLSTVELKENNRRDSWIDYHHAHFCLITGKLEEGLRVLEPLLYSTLEKDPNKRLSMARLFAEIIGAMGKFELALHRLKGVMNSIDLASTKPTVLAQATATEVWLLTQQKRYGDATHLCETLLADSVKRNDKLGAAIALTHDGIIHRLSGSRELAREQLLSAVQLFRECSVKRGLAWSLSHLAIAQLLLRHHDQAIVSLGEALKVYSDIGECSVEYLETLREAKEHLADQKITRIIDAESRRVRSILGDSMGNQMHD